MHVLWPKIFGTRTRKVSHSLQAYRVSSIHVHYLQSYSLKLKISPRAIYNQNIYCPHHLPANFVVKFHKSNRRQSPHTLQAYKASSIRLHYLWSYRLILKFRPGPHLVIPYTVNTIRLDQASTTRLGNNEGLRSVIRVK